jgi:hypothetical protein
MKRFSEQLHKKAMTVKLRAAEKRDLRERVVSYMEYHPLPKEIRSTNKKHTPTLVSEEFRVVAFPFKLLTRWVAGTAVLILLIVPFAAERSVPGDSLYAVKRFNEEVRGTLAFDTIQKVEWETERLNRRIAEARLLASEGRLTDEVEAEVAEAVRTHSENAQKNIEVLRGEDADEATLASIALETTLSVQSAALQEDGQSSDGTATLASVVEETRAKTNATNASSTIPAYDKVMARVEQNTTRVYELLHSLQDQASSEQIAEVTRRIEDIERSVAEALKLRESADEEARSILIDALQRTQKLIVFMTDIEVSQSVDIEEIVPVVLTDEEKQAMLSAYRDEIDTKIARINEAVLLVSDEELLEKTSVILSEIDTNISQLGTSTEFLEAQTTLLSALDLVNNIYVVLELDQQVADSEGVELPEDEDLLSETASTTATSSVETIDTEGATTTAETATTSAATSTDDIQETVDTE